MQQRTDENRGLKYTQGNQKTAGNTGELNLTHETGEAKVNTMHTGQEAKTEI